MKLSRFFWCVFWMLTGILIGTILGKLCGQFSFLQWLTVGQDISFSPAADLAILQFHMDLHFTLNLAQVVGILTGVLCYHKFEF